MFPSNCLKLNSGDNEALLLGAKSTYSKQTKKTASPLPLGQVSECHPTFFPIPMMPLVLLYSTCARPPYLPYHSHPWSQSFYFTPRLQQLLPLWSPSQIPSLASTGPQFSYMHHHPLNTSTTSYQSSSSFNGYLVNTVSTSRSFSPPKAIHSIAPPYLFALLHVATPSHSRRSPWWAELSTL